jgi:hypothetical protein
MLRELLSDNRKLTRFLLALMRFVIGIRKWRAPNLVLGGDRRRMSASVSAVLTPPLTLETGARKIRAAEDSWHSRDPQRVALRYSVDKWRNRSEFLNGRAAIIEFLNS